MAIPLKNGADLYNFEVLRMRFHNLGADPTSDFGVGQVYFNTSTSEGSGKRVRIYDGSAFRSLAYFDEIDNRLKLLEGEIDTDAIISNMKEVSAFLAGFEEDARLMDVLNGKLDKAGGTMNLAKISSFMINRTDGGSPAIGFSSNGAYWGSIGFSSNGVPVVYDGSQVKYNLVYSANIGDYALFPKTAKLLTSSNSLDNYTQGLFGYKDGNNPINSYGDNAAVLSLKGVKDAAAFQLAFDGNDTKVGYRTKNYAGVWKAWKTIAFTDSDITGSVLNSDGDILLTYNDGLLLGYGSALKSKNTIIYGNSVVMRYSSNRTQGFILNSSGNVTIGSTDLAGTNAKLYVDGFAAADYYYFTEADGTYASYVGRGGSTSDVYLYSTAALRFFAGKTLRLLVNESGNVLIGTTTDNDEKLHVKGNVRATEIFVGTESQRYGRFTWASSGTADLVAESGNILRLGVGSTRSMRIETDGLISLLNDTTINGNLHVTGNIIADGEVSAGGAGEEGDTGTGTGGGDALIYSQEFTPTTTSITITHNLSATKGVIVQVWEKNGNYWDMVLVDVEEVDTNTVTLFFGKTETTVHKVVIMG